MTISEVAKRVGVCENTIRRLIKNGELPHIRISPRRVVIVPEHLDQWLAEKAKGA